MGITISAVVLLLVALAAVLLGFFLASTGIAPAVNNALSSLATAIAQITA